MLARLRNGGPRVNWAVLISAASLVLALFGGLWAAVQSQINTVKELTANDRQAIRHQLEDNDRVTEQLRDRKLDAERFNQALMQIGKALDALDQRVDRLEQRGH
jgi:septal ring factor EnvC (AmiA/AmiB activator)